MSVITIFSGSCCKKEQVIEKLLPRTGYRLITDNDMVAEAARTSGLADNKLERAFSAKTSVFNKFTHEKERSIAYLRRALARTLSQDNLLIAGFSTHLIPRDINHVLRVCLIAEMKFRIAVAGENKGLSPKEATKLIHRQDEDSAAWVHYITGVKDPWDASLYDIVIPMDKMTVEEAATLIEENLAKDVVKSTDASRRAVEDFLLAANVSVALAEEGHHVDVKAGAGAVEITINEHVIALGKLEEELKSIAEKVHGVESVSTRVGKNFYKADIYRRYDFEMPSKVLLVDDEREFVQTLSERLIMRDMGSVVAYDGESALKLVSSDEPDVMILDLRMPGIDGIEVLRRVKKSNPEIEVVILTGHGSREDKKVCMDLGAFAYLHKPVDINVLSETLKKAYEKIQAKRRKNG
ncbi:MAG: response regulator [Desulfococcus sp. 4484_242]|nr:MAG: response regulator [Desulfococcus sp. 4484_242]